MKRFFYLLAALVFSVHLQAQNDEMNDARKAFEDDINLMKDSFNISAEKARKEYEEYEAKMRAEYNQYVRSIRNVWGNDNTIDDTPTEWVEYARDFKSRSIVDFDKGNIDVEIILDDVNDNDSTEIERRLAEAIEEMLNSRGNSCPFGSNIDKNLPLTKAPILEGIVDLSAYNISELQQATTGGKKNKKLPPAPKTKGKELVFNDEDTEKDSENGKGETIAKDKNKKREDARLIAEEKKQKREEALEKAKEKNKKREEERLIAEESKRRQEEALEAAKANRLDTKQVAQTIAKQSKKTSTTIKGDDNKNRKVVKVQMALVSDNISKNAALYKDYVKAYSQKFQIEEPLIYAVMEQESRFNPEATSWVPAYGLMQLVPKSGGLDAYNYVYKKQWVPTRSYLFVPHQNIELGTAYLRILMNQFAKVTDPECRRLCVIAGYNTGAGNVSRAFTGNTNLKNAIPLINKYSYKELYNHLTNELNTEEARNYVSGVSKRREKYLK